MSYDCVIVGGGPAAVSAALTLRARNKTVAFITGSVEDISLSRAHEIANYPGMPAVSGRAMVEAMQAQAVEAGAELLRGHVNSILSLGESFGVSYGSEFAEGTAVILCTGVAPGKKLPGEAELLGRGVSYCVTCDGMLYRGRRVCVLGFTADAAEEAELLRSMGCDVQFFTDKKAKYALEGGDKVTGLSVNGESVPCEGVFILRSTAAPDSLLEGLKMDGPHIAVDRGMAASVPGVFAAGDCVGAPYQVAKAVGDGNVAAISASKYIEERKKGGM
ncbi:MAG: NAD(P)/FAD-dependent oxidoreductase [Oscillospiraceae bacterium]|nr:NAD(P)/FAD-dependent oxidoreductase [Oscillospiraceae bacterium]